MSGKTKEEEQEEQLPIEVPPMNQTEVATTPNLTSIVKNDLGHINGLLVALESGWSRVFNVDDLCKMVLTTTKVLEVRRKALNMPWGTESTGSFNGNAKRLAPYED